MEEFKVFEKGDFITETSKPGSFVIFEGINTSPSYKKLSVIVNYEPSKYYKHDDGEYYTSPFFEIATNNSRCEKCLYDEKETYWFRLCTPLEKEKALEVLEEHGYKWDEETMSIIDIATGKVVRRVVEPKTKYSGEVVRPITKKLKDLLRCFCVESNKKKYTYSGGSTYPSYRGSYDYYDYYNRRWEEQDYYYD